MTGFPAAKAPDSMNTNTGLPPASWRSWVTSCWYQEAPLASVVISCWLNCPFEVDVHRHARVNMLPRSISPLNLGIRHLRRYVVRLIGQRPGQQVSVADVAGRVAGRCPDLIQPVPDGGLVPGLL